MLFPSVQVIFFANFLWCYFPFSSCNISCNVVILLKNYFLLYVSLWCYFLWKFLCSISSHAIPCKLVSLWSLAVLFITLPSNSSWCNPFQHYFLLWFPVKLCSLWLLTTLFLPAIHCNAISLCNFLQFYLPVTSRNYFVILFFLAIPCKTISPWNSLQL